MKRGTIRFRITAIATLAVVVVLSAAAVALVVLQRRVLTDSLDETLRQESASLSAVVEANGVPAELVPRGDDEAVAQLVDAGDDTIVAGGSRTPARPLAPPPDSEVAVRTISSISGLEGRQRVVSRRVEGRAGETFVLHIATPLDDVDDSTTVLARSLLVTIPVVAVVLAALVWWLVGRTLRPVEAIRGEAATIRSGRLDHRVPEPSGDDEIARLARTMNAMLDRLETADTRQRQFVGDASHELRTPLTRMRTALEVDRAHPETADVVATHADLLDDVMALQQLIEDLLLLTRATGELSVTRDPVDLAAVVTEEAGRADRDATVAITTTVAPAKVRGDRVALARVVRNLLDNAIRHARSQVTVSVTALDSHGVVEVADDGPGIPAERRDEVFDRFTRLDEARSGGAGGAGLGLSIVREIVARHEGSVVVDDRPGGGARFTVTLPLDGNSGGAGADLIFAS